MNERAERGSVTVLVIVVAMALMLAIGLVIDGGGKVSATAAAERAASEAARAAGQQITGASIGGGDPGLATQRAVGAAQAHLAAAGVAGSVGLQGDVITVETTDTYRPMLLPLGSFTVTGSAQVRIGQT